MTRRSSKIKEEAVVDNDADLKIVRKVGRPKKTTVLKNKKTEIAIKVTKNPVKIAEVVLKKNDKNIIFDSLAIYEKQERRKIIIMWFGVSFFMFIIAGFWIYNTKKIFEQDSVKSNANVGFSLDELSKSVRDVSDRIGEFKQELASSSSILASTTIDQVIIATSTGTLTLLASSTPAKPDLVVEELKEKLIASTTDAGAVKGISEERDIIIELKNKLAPWRNSGPEY